MFETLKNVAGQTRLHELERLHEHLFKIRSIYTSCVKDHKLKGFDIEVCRPPAKTELLLGKDDSTIRRLIDRIHSPKNQADSYLHIFVDS